MKNKFIIYDRNESFVQSLCSDLVTFGLLIFCIWFSYVTDGWWWVFLSAVMFFMAMSAKVSNIADKRRMKIKSKKEAIEWANSLPDDDK